MKKSKILDNINKLETKIIDAIGDLQDFLDSTEDPEISGMGAEFCEMTIDFMYENDTVNINDIKSFIENELE